MTSPHPSCDTGRLRDSVVGSGVGMSAAQNKQFDLNALKLGSVHGAQIQSDLKELEIWLNDILLSNMCLVFFMKVIFLVKA